MKTIHDDILNVLISEEEINERVSQLAAAIHDDYIDKSPIFVSILRGSFIFMADLVRKVDIPCTMEFMSVSSYGSGTTSSGSVAITRDLQVDIEGRHVIIVEDILDTGRTLSYLNKLLMARNPASLAICTLLDKPERRVTEVKADYYGFRVPNEFVVGYGLDYADYYRNLPYIGILKPEVYENE